MDHKPKLTPSHDEDVISSLQQTSRGSGSDVRRSAGTFEDVKQTAPERSLLEKPLLSEDPLKPLYVPSPPPPLLDKSKCFSKECFPEVAEKDYLKEYSDPHGALKSMASLGIFPFHNLTIKVYVYTAADVEAVQELTTGKSMSLTFCSIGMW